MQYIIREDGLDILSVIYNKVNLNILKVESGVICCSLKLFYTSTWITKLRAVLVHKREAIQHFKTTFKAQ